MDRVSGNRAELMTLFILLCNPLSYVKRSRTQEALSITEETVVKCYIVLFSEFPSSLHLHTWYILNIHIHNSLFDYMRSALAMHTLNICDLCAVYLVYF